MQPDLITLTASYWMAIVAGLMGLSIRFSRVALPNGGLEPRSMLDHLWRLVRVWIEATGSAFIFALMASAFMILKQDALKIEASPILLALATFIGAAGSDLWARWASNPAQAPKDVADALGGLADVWRRFKGDAA